MAIELVGQVTGSNYRAPVTLTHTSTAGNTLILCVHHHGVATSPTITDTAGNTWQIAGDTTSASGNEGRGTMYYCIDADPVTSVTVPQQSSVVAANLTEWSGVASLRGATSGYQQYPSSHSVTTAAQEDDLVVSQASVWAQNENPPTPSAGWSALSSAGSGSNWVASAYNHTSGGNVGPTFTMPAGAGKFGIVTAAFIPIVEVDTLEASVGANIFVVVEGGMRNMQTGDIVTGGQDAAEMYVGAHNLPIDEQSFQDLEALTGRMGIRRTYSGGLPSDFATTPGWSNVGKRATWHSVKADWGQMAAGTLDATVEAFCATVPSDHELMLTFAHEPENDGGNATEWRAAQTRFYDVVKGVRPDILVGPVLMGYTFNPSSGRAIADWTPVKKDFIGLDEYNPYLFPMVGSPTTWRNVPSTQMTAFSNLCDDEGVPGAIGETATAEDETGIGPQRKVDWINDMIDYAETRGWLAVCWFNAYKPGDTSESMMLDSSPQALAAWSAQVVAHQRGVI